MSYINDRLSENAMLEALKADGLSESDIRAMDMKTFAGYRARAGLTNPDPIAQAQAQVTPRTVAPVATPPTAATAQTEQEPAGVSLDEVLKGMSNEEYAQVRGQFGMGQSRKEGVGLFNQTAGSQSEAYRAAASQQAGRNAMVGSNVIPSPAIARPNLVGVDRPALDTRSVAERFGTVSNSYRYEG